MTQQELQASYRWCQEIARKSHSSFYRSFALLRPERQRAMNALYAFARIVDDIGDCGNPTTAASQLQSWRDWIEHIHGDDSSLCVVEEQTLLKPAFQDLVTRFEIPLDLFRDLISGIESDLDASRCIRTWHDLERYCYCVAGTIGLACIRIWGGDLTKVSQAANACGFAFQMTNILRDVGEDAKQSRVFLPQQAFDQYGVSRPAWLKCRPDGNWMAMMTECFDRTEASYQLGYQVGYELEYDGQRMFSLMWQTYHQLLGQVRRNPQANFDHRVSLPSTTKLRLAVSHFLSPWYSLHRPFTNPDNQSNSTSA